MPKKLLKCQYQNNIINIDINHPERDDYKILRLNLSITPTAFVMDRPIFYSSLIHDAIMNFRYNKNDKNQDN